MDRKNYSFYMPADFGDKLEKIQEADDRIAVLSKSQAVYFIISEIAQSGKYSKNENEQ